MNNTYFTILIAILSLVFGAVASLVISWYFSFRRSLNFIITSASNIIQLGRIPHGKIQVLYEGKNIESLWAIRMVLENSGNFDINQGDVRVVPKICIGEEMKIIDIEPVNLAPVLSNSLQKFLDKRPETPGLLRPGMNGRP